jgi:predicted extracellular nuclease
MQRNLGTLMAARGQTIMKRTSAAIALLVVLSTPAFAQVSLNTANVTVTENFNALAQSGTSSTLPTGWAFFETGTAADTTYGAGTGSSTAGNTYSFGPAADPDRAFGTQQSGSLISTIGAQFLNNTGDAITGLEIGYTGEMWRRGTTGRADRIDFQYSLDATSLNTGTWIDVNALDFNSPSGTPICPDPEATGATPGNSANCRLALNTTIPSLSIANGASFWIRWTDFNASGADDGLAVDDFSLTPQGGPPLPTLSIGDVSLAEGDAGTSNFNFMATLNAPAGAGGVSFTAASVNGTATLADNDYIQLTPTIFNIPATQTQVSVTVAVNGDVANEGNETFTVVLSALMGAQAGDLSGLGVILNDDGVTPIDVSINDPVITEGDSGTSLITFAVTLDSPASPGGVSFDIQTNPGTALETTDFVPRSLMAQSIPEGQSSYQLQVQVVGDILRETPAAENFTVTLANVTGNGAGSVDTSSTGTINDNDPIPRTIAELQGTGVASPFASTVQSSFGNVVTAVGNDLFAMQMPGVGDGDAFTSDGILVFTGGVPNVAVGDLVDVKGNLVEFFEQTEFTVTGGGLTVNVVGTSALPTPTVFDGIIPSPAPTVPACQGTGSTIPTNAPIKTQNFECYESMLVTTANGIINTQNQSFGGSPPDPIAENWFATGGVRVMREAGVDPAVGNEPGLPATVARWDGNPELFEFDVDRLGLPSQALASGTTISATGVIGYDFGGYELWPTAYTVMSSPAALPIPAPTPGINQVSVGSFNVENLFDTVDDPLTDDTILTPTQLDLKLGKLSAYIRNALRAPTVLALIEVENQTALDALSARIAADDPSIQYTGIIFSGNDPRGINNAFLYRNIPAPTVSQLRLNQMTNECSGTAPCTLHDRPTLLLQGVFTTTDAQQRPFAVMVSHFRSLLGIDDQGNLPGANRIRRKRLEQAVAIAEETQAFQTANPTVPLVSLGDFNAFEFTDGYADVTGIVSGTANVANDAFPRDTVFEIQDIYPAIPGNIVNPPLAEAMLSLPVGERYSYLFGCGSSSAGCFAQALDHTLLNSAAQSVFATYGFGRGNADAPAAQASVALSPLASSDHDGSVLILSLGNELFGNGFE